MAMGTGKGSSQSDQSGDKNSTKKSSGILTYEKSYTPEVAKKWEAKGGKEAYIKAAKAWNIKKYGTTEPSSIAKKKGMSKEVLAKEHATAITRVEPKGPAKIETITETTAGERMKIAIDSANDPDDLLTGVTNRRRDRLTKKVEKQKEKYTKKESAKQEKQNLLTDSPVDDRSVRPGKGWRKSGAKGKGVSKEEYIKYGKFGKARWSDKPLTDVQPEFQTGEGTYQGPGSSQYKAQKKEVTYYPGTNIRKS